MKLLYCAVFGYLIACSLSHSEEEDLHTAEDIRIGKSKYSYEANAKYLNKKDEGHKPLKNRQHDQHDQGDHSHGHLHEHSYHSHHSEHQDDGHDHHNHDHKHADHLHSNQHGHNNHEHSKQNAKSMNSHEHQHDHHRHNHAKERDHEQQHEHSDNSQDHINENKHDTSHHDHSLSENQDHENEHHHHYESHEHQRGEGHHDHHNHIHENQHIHGHHHHHDHHHHHNHENEHSHGHHHHHEDQHHSHDHQYAHHGHDHAEEREHDHKNEHRDNSQDHINENKHDTPHKHHDHGLSKNQHHENEHHHHTHEDQHEEGHHHHHHHHHHDNHNHNYENQHNHGHHHHEHQHGHEHHHEHDHHNDKDILNKFLTVPFTYLRNSCCYQHFLKPYVDIASENIGVFLKYRKLNESEIWQYALFSTFVISIAPFIILFFLQVDSSIQYQPFLKVLLSFASGGLLGDAFLHLIPHASHSHHHHEHLNHVHSHEGHDHSGDIKVGLNILLGFFTFFIIEKFICSVKGGHDHHKDHHHDQKSKTTECSGDGKNGANTSAEHCQTDQSTIKVSGFLNLAADSAHNFTDGLAIAASFYAGWTSGVITTITIFFHEIPHEIGDFAILIQSGFSRGKAMLAQLFTAIGAFTGCIFGLIMQGKADDSTTAFILPFTAGGFIYIATVSVIPELLSEKSSLWQTIKECIAIASGIYLMVIIAFYE